MEIPWNHYINKLVYNYIPTKLIYHLCVCVTLSVINIHKRVRSEGKDLNMLLTEEEIDRLS